MDLLMSHSFFQAKPQLIDMPVSNNGARVRMVLYYKQLEALVDVVSPADAYGGLKTPAFLALNPQGKMPILVVPADQGGFEAGRHLFVSLVGCGVVG